MFSKTHFLLSMRLYLQYISGGDHRRVNRIREKAIKLAHCIRDTFIDLVTSDKNQWLDVKSKENIRNKITQMQLYIGFPDYILDDKFINSLYTFDEKFYSKITDNYFFDVKLFESEIQKKLEWYEVNKPEMNW